MKGLYKTLRAASISLLPLIAGASISAAEITDEAGVFYTELMASEVSKQFTELEGSISASSVLSFETGPYEREVISLAVSTMHSDRPDTFYVMIGDQHYAVEKDGESARFLKISDKLVDRMEQVDSTLSGLVRETTTQLDESTTIETIYKRQ